MNYLFGVRKLLHTNSLATIRSTGLIWGGYCYYNKACPLLGKRTNFRGVCFLHFDVDRVEPAISFRGWYVASIWASGKNLSTFFLRFLTGPG